MNPERSEPPRPQPQYERFEDEEAFQQAVDRLLEKPGRELRIFDPDLSGLRLNLLERISRLQRFLMASRTRRIYIAIHDPGYLAKYCPRMRDLMARYAHAVQVQQTDEEIRELQDAFFVLDANHYVRRPAARFWRAIGSATNPRHCRCAPVSWRSGRHRTRRFRRPRSACSAAADIILPLHRASGRTTTQLRDQGNGHEQITAVGRASGRGSGRLRPGAETQARRTRASGKARGSRGSAGASARAREEGRGQEVSFTATRRRCPARVTAVFIFGGRAC
jgi:hypothetical protein